VARLAGPGQGTSIDHSRLAKGMLIGLMINNVLDDVQLCV